MDSRLWSVYSLTAYLIEIQIMYAPLQVDRNAIPNSSARVCTLIEELTMHATFYVWSALVENELE